MNCQTNKDLSQKLLILFLLNNVIICQTCALHIDDNLSAIIPTHLQNHSKPSYPNKQVTFVAYKLNKNLCPVATVR